MATAAQLNSATDQQDGFFLWGGIAMATVITAGFTFFVIMGISSFRAPLIVHTHAVIFFGWVAIYIAQTWLATRGNIALHRRLGWLGAGWLVAMAIIGPLVAIEAVRTARAAPVYEPAYFLIFAPVTVWTFVALSAAAVGLRRHTEWHRRLHFTGMSILTGPGFGRLIPAPLVMNHAAVIELALTLIFPVAGILWDRKTRGRVHPAWWVGIGAVLASRVIIHLIAYSPIGLSLYQALTTGQPGAARPPYEVPILAMLGG